MKIIPSTHPPRSDDVIYIQTLASTNRIHMHNRFIWCIEKYTQHLISNKCWGYKEEIIACQCYIHEYYHITTFDVRFSSTELKSPIRKIFDLSPPINIYTKIDKNFLSINGKVENKILDPFIPHEAVSLYACFLPFQIF